MSLIPKIPLTIYIPGINHPIYFSHYTVPIVGDIMELEWINTNYEYAENSSPIVESRFCKVTSIKHKIQQYSDTSDSSIIVHVHAIGRS